MNNNQKVDQKDLIANQVSVGAGNEIARLLQINAQLTVVAAHLQQERDQLKTDNEKLKSQLKPTDNVVVPEDNNEVTK